MEIWLTRFYLLILLGMAIYGWLGIYTLWLYWRHRHEQFPTPSIQDSELPYVTVQFPIYNERYVIKRLINAAVALDYPHERLEIQIIDDSADDTTAIAANLVKKYQLQGIDIKLLHRSERVGYKAGALEAAMGVAKGELLAIFDADFCPAPNFLHETVPHFSHDAALGMIQARWGHLNAEQSALTLVQAIAIDKHFAMEQTVRHRAAMFPKFNGSGGIWRRTALIEAGGWQADTVCEDLCLSTRALLQGWQFKYLDAVVAPAELPDTVTAYKNQQARWAKGSIQCVIKYFRPILSTPKHSLTARLYALISMGAYLANGLLVALLLLQMPMMLLAIELSPWVWLLAALGLGHPLMFIWGQQVTYRNWLWRLRHFPTMLLITVGLAPSQIRATFAAILPIEHEFVRTPKGTGQRDHYKLPFDWIILIELGLAIYGVVGFSVAFGRNYYLLAFLFGWCALGFALVGVTSMWEARKQ